MVKMREPFIFLCSEITRENAFTLIKWLKDDEVTRYLSDSDNVSDDIQAVLDRVNLPILTHIFNQNGRFYMVYNKQKKPVGFVRLIIEKSETEIVIVIGDRGNWGKKLGVSAIRESIKIAFFEYRTQKIVAKIDQKNIRSIRAFSGAGFKIERVTNHYYIFSITMRKFLDIMKGEKNMDQLYISEIDKARLKKIIDGMINGSVALNNRVLELSNELSRAKIVDSKEIPENIVTMNSKVNLCLNGEEMMITLVYPDEADITENKLSVLSPVGTAILGYRVGNIIKWDVPEGVAEIHIKELLYQPEAAGDYHL
jgi:regulator of nucleoside diphosphate kinase